MKKKPKIRAPRVANNAGYQVQDTWFHRAKAEGYRARSAFKLLQIQEKYHIIKPGMRVLDLGCAPGSWIQVLQKIIGEWGQILGVDLQTVDKYAQKNINTIVGDITSKEVEDQIFAHLIGKKLQGPMSNNQCEIEKSEPLNGRLKIEDGRLFNLITSDIAPNTTGRNDDDQYHSAMLDLEILKIARKFLSPGGSLVMKIFVGNDTQKVFQEAKKFFDTVTQFKPPACRDRSFETYIICLIKN